MDKRPLKPYFTAGNITEIGEFESGDTISNDHLKLGNTSMPGIVQIATHEDIMAGNNDKVISSQGLNSILGVSNGIPTLDMNSRIPMEQMPAGINTNPTTLDWSNITNTPNTTLVINGDVSGTCVFTSLQDATMTVSVVDDSHKHGNISITDLDWTKITNKTSASSNTAGITTLATDIETLAGISNVKAVTPGGLRSTINVIGGICGLDGNGKILASTLVSHKHGDADITGVDWSKLANIPASTQTVSGTIRLATAAEAIDDTINNKAITPQTVRTNYIMKAGDAFTGNVGLPALGAVTAPTLYFKNVDGTVGTGITSPIKNQLSFSTSGVEAVRINDAGRISIGTTNAYEVMNINGNIHFYNAGAKVTLWSDSNYGSVEIGCPADNTGKLYFSKGVNNGSIILFGKKDSAGAFTAEMILNNAGELCINTTEVGQKLNLDGNIALCGTGHGVRFLKDTTYGNIQIYENNDDIRIAHNANPDSDIVFGGVDGTGLFTPQLIINNVGDAIPGADDSLNLGSASNRWKDVFASNGVTQTSDFNKKKDIQDSPLGLQFIQGLRPVNYKWKEDNGDKDTHYGFIAQEVKKLVDTVGESFAGYSYDPRTDAHSLRYFEFIAPIVKAIQELSEKVSKLEGK